MQKLTGMEWLKKHIKELEVTNSTFKAQIKQITRIKPEVYNEFKEWTPLKLILLNYALNVCTTIIKNTPLFKKSYYVDLFAGSGINKIKGTEDFLIGSPLIASLNHSGAYDAMIFCEKKPSFSVALDLRLKFLKKNNLNVMKKDYELCLGRILKKVSERNTYSFFFIDPHCMEFKWNDMKKVLKVRSDIIFTFMSSEIYRAVGLARTRIGKGESLTEVFGDDSWKAANNSDDLVEIYNKNILKARSEAPIRTIKIKSEQFNFCYHLFFITNKTKGENKWLRAIDKAKKEIENNSDKSVEMALNIIKKRQSELSQF
ncbi:hypothetical protein CMO83_03480 [Candidatus Woesearchaeota archaeon]|jgi:three-Cys-motif partner protein|nr:hypothetical protein [Candidatus Woesearchaeota archaeon]|tara:strand:- start:6652 stop:7596 length:945 start_codon:yes stop_codon:yes gene_type:complete